MALATDGPGSNNSQDMMEVLSTTIFLEQSVGHLEVALAVALLMILIAVIALCTIRLVGQRSLVKL